MVNLIPDYIMIPREGDTVLRGGFDADKRPFTVVMGESSTGSGNWLIRTSSSDRSFRGNIRTANRDMTSPVVSRDFGHFGVHTSIRAVAQMHIGFQQILHRCLKWVLVTLQHGLGDVDLIPAPAIHGEGSSLWQVTAASP